jgi:histidinol-phosphate aminotransferase
MSTLAAGDFSELAMPGVRSLSPYQPGKPESELRRELGLERVVKLASNENPLGPSPKAVAAASDCLVGCHRYPDGNGFELKRAIAAGIGCVPEQLTLGNGSNDVLELICRAFAGPGRSVVYARHGFAVYPLATQAVGAEGCEAPANGPGHQQPYGHDLDAIARLVREDTRVVFVANPNNPTGTWLRETELEAFLRSLPRHVIAVVDQAYLEYVDGTKVPDATPWLDRLPNLVVTRTFSKAYGLAGLRVGYAVSHPRVADLLNRVRQPFNLNLVAQAAALAALADHQHLERSRTLNSQQRRRLTAEFERMGLAVIPSAANFLCVDFGQPAGPLFQRLLQRGVIVRPVANYALPEHLRITIGTGPENDLLLQALRDVLL